MMKIGFKTSLVFLLLQASALACLCAIPEVVDEYNQTDAVFTGKVTQVDDHGQPNKNRLIKRGMIGDETGQSQAATVYFKINKSWKGPVANIELNMDFNKGQCGSVYFIEDFNYLVFAKKEDNSELYYADVCSLTREQSRADDIIKTLNTFPYNRIAPIESHNED